MRSLTTTCSSRFRHSPGAGSLGRRARERAPSAISLFLSRCILTGRESPPPPPLRRHRISWREGTSLVLLACRYVRFPLLSLSIVFPAAAAAVAVAATATAAEFSFHLRVALTLKKGGYTLHTGQDVDEYRTRNFVLPLGVERERERDTLV